MIYTACEVIPRPYLVLGWQNIDCQYACHVHGPAPCACSTTERSRTGIPLRQAAVHSKQGFLHTHMHCCFESEWGQSLYASLTLGALAVTDTHKCIVTATNRPILPFPTPFMDAGWKCQLHTWGGGAHILPYVLSGTSILASIQDEHV